ncbi:hypothetical protein L9F63_000893, partial [Diploptera punctata]
LREVHLMYAHNNRTEVNHILERFKMFTTDSGRQSLWKRKFLLTWKNMSLFNVVPMCNDGNAVT